MTKTKTHTPFSQTDLLLPFQVKEFKLSRFPISMSAGVRSLSDLVRHGTNSEVPLGVCYVFMNDTRTIASIFAYDSLGNSRFITKWYPVRHGAKFDVEPYMPKGRRAPAPFVDLTEDQFRDLLSKHILPTPTKTSK